MSCGNSNYYPMNYYSGYYPNSSMMDRTAQQPAGFPGMMPSGPTYAAPVVPIGTGHIFPGTIEESFIENILRFNKGKIGTFYFTYQGNNRWNSMVYRGRVETAGRDHIIISDPSTGKRYLLLMANLDWVEFDEQINYPIMEISPQIQATLTTSD
ncbi:spore coat protein GerQ [Bacillus sp. B15-48]|uniref:spore coat protein GerQ n=1 Tax=Bacillus sp. B15-48 TaxID=1548601 RepID=UPI00193F8B45|nr:spore coat protein GerQ [Bacillus sp. B15-48]MBM4763578.1 spore coat protein GerQ [Bacillus sp. B15-48]